MLGAEQLCTGCVAYRAASNTRRLLIQTPAANHISDPIPNPVLTLSQNFPTKKFEIDM